jgi:hypothetical protein
MRVAVTVSGPPRFCSDFDLFLSNLKNYDQIDWFFYLGIGDKSPDKIGYEKLNLIAPTWRNPKRSWAYEKIRSNLPENSQLIRFETYDPNQIEIPEVKGNVLDATVSSVWKMHHGWLQADSMRQDHERHTGEYDLVIRGRPDISIDRPIDLTALKKYLDKHPQSIIVPENGHHGYVYRTCDIMAVSSSQNISIYTDLINHSLTYHYRDRVVFHPETLLSYHLLKNGLETIKGPFHFGLRTNLKELDGKLTPNFSRWS